MKAQIPTENIDADNPLIHYIGRIDNSNPKEVRFAYPGISINFSFEGSVCNIRIKDVPFGKDVNGNYHHNYYDVSIDNQDPFIMEIEPGKELYKVDNLSDKLHTITLFKRTEAMVGESVFMGFEIAKGKPKQLQTSNNKRLKMEFIGNSITCGYGNEGGDKSCKFSAKTENNHKAFGALTAQKMNAEYVAVAYSGKGLIRNYDLSTDETMTDLYFRTLPHDKQSKWNFKNWSPDYIVILLGANDFAKGVPDSITFINRYVEFVKAINGHYPHAQFICCVYPTNNPSDKIILTNYIKSSLGQLNHHGIDKTYLYKFKTKIVDYGCDYHYGIKTHEIMSEELTTFIQQVVNK